MVGHGFKSEVAQNKNMASTFDNNSLNNDTPKSQSLQELSTNSSDTPLGKKVNFIFPKTKKQISLFSFLDINIRRKTTYDA